MKKSVSKKDGEILNSYGRNEFLLSAKHELRIQQRLTPEWIRFKDVVFEGLEKDITLKSSL